MCLSRAVSQEILSPGLLSLQRGKLVELLSVGRQGRTVRAQTHRYNVKLSGPSEKSLQVKSSFLSWRSSTSCAEELVTRLKALGYNCKVSRHESISFFINPSEEICRGSIQTSRTTMKLASCISFFPCRHRCLNQELGSHLFQEIPYVISTVGWFWQISFKNIQHNRKGRRLPEHILHMDSVPSTLGSRSTPQ